MSHKQHTAGIWRPPGSQQSICHTFILRGTKRPAAEIVCRAVILSAPAKIYWWCIVTTVWMMWDIIAKWNLAVGGVLPCVTSFPRLFSWGRERQRGRESGSATTVIEPRSASPGPGKRIANHKQEKSSRVASECPLASSDLQGVFVLFVGFKSRWGTSKANFNRTGVPRGRL